MDRSSFSVSLLDDLGISKPAEKTFGCRTSDECFPIDRKADKNSILKIAKPFVHEKESDSLIVLLRDSNPQSNVSFELVLIFFSLSFFISLSVLIPPFDCLLLLSSFPPSLGMIPWCGYVFPPPHLFILLPTSYPSSFLPVHPSCFSIFRQRATTRIPTSNTQSWTLPFSQRHHLVTEPPFLLVGIWLSTQPSRLTYVSAPHCQPFSLQMLSSRYVRQLLPSPQRNVGWCSSCLWDVSSILPFFFLPEMWMVLVIG